ncbi:hypothetical protein CROQUDRAFT_100166 [Cronartium quercuum f. sp. fusiforme G11]|uniref:Uncharacterized protein n=1 Tax=Cronartium quercuum f. sp. fusiforme G11 TaxID=708437 RepID=A0A9P6N705_9BASI|nr:hypothetical protein CROQUDRAFT_100166 [Cronartium quercuum f. sp. fusiforme G11]
MGAQHSTETSDNSHFTDHVAAHRSRIGCLSCRIPNGSRVPNTPYNAVALERPGRRVRKLRLPARRRLDVFMAVVSKVRKIELFVQKYGRQYHNSLSPGEFKDIKSRKNDQQQSVMVHWQGSLPPDMSLQLPTSLKIRPRPCLPTRAKPSCPNVLITLIPNFIAILRSDSGS